MLKRWNTITTFDTLDEATNYIKNVKNKSFIYNIEIDYLNIMHKWIVEIHYKAICEGGDR